MIRSFMSTQLIRVTRVGGTHCPPPHRASVLIKRRGGADRAANLSPCGKESHSHTASPPPPVQYEGPVRLSIFCIIPQSKALQCEDWGSIWESHWHVMVLCYLVICGSSSTTNIFISITYLTVACLALRDSGLVKNPHLLHFFTWWLTMTVWVWRHSSSQQGPQQMGLFALINITTAKNALPPCYW